MQIVDAQIDLWGTDTGDYYAVARSGVRTVRRRRGTACTVSDRRHSSLSAAMTAIRFSARGLPVGPNIRISDFSGTPMRRPSRAKPTVAMITSRSRIPRRAEVAIQHGLHGLLIEARPETLDHDRHAPSWSHENLWSVASVGFLFASTLQTPVFMSDRSRGRGRPDSLARSRSVPWWTPSPTLLSEDVLPAFNRAKAVLTVSAAGVTVGPANARKGYGRAQQDTLAASAYQYGNVKGTICKGFTKVSPANDSQRLMSQGSDS